MTDYDSTQATLNHIRKVQQCMDRISAEITIRSIRHDESKFEEPEKSFFDQYTLLLASLEYGSDEYMAMLEKIRPALDHHYEANRHHPEHFVNGVNDMTLVDVVEMLCDWQAAAQRHDTGGIKRSLEVNAERFGLSPQLVAILRNTAVEYGWIDGA